MSLKTKADCNKCSKKNILPFWFDNSCSLGKRVYKVFILKTSIGYYPLLSKLNYFQLQHFASDKQDMTTTIIKVPSLRYIYIHLQLGSRSLRTCSDNVTVKKKLHQKPSRGQVCLDVFLVHLGVSATIICGNISYHSNSKTPLLVKRRSLVLNTGSHLCCVS